MLHGRSRESVAFPWVSPLPISEVKHPSGNYTMLLVWLKKKKSTAEEVVWKVYTGPQNKSPLCMFAWWVCLQDTGSGCGCQPGSSNTNISNSEANLNQNTFTQRLKKYIYIYFFPFSINTALYHVFVLKKHCSTYAWPVSGAVMPLQNTLENKET